MLSIGHLWNIVKARNTIVPGHAEIVSPRVIGGVRGPNPIMPERDYFGIIVNELFLEHRGKWFQEYDPLVLAITEFEYGGEIVILSFVVGPKLLGDYATNMPQGMLYRNTRVAGIHPFRGGRVISTVVLSRSMRLDYARQLVKLVESVSTAVPFGGDLGTYTKLAGTILDGIDALLGVGQTVPLVGLRQEFDHNLADPIRPAFFALIDAPETDVPWTKLWVKNGSLLIGDTPETLQPFRAASYVLYSTHGTEHTTEINTFKFAKDAQDIIEIAASPEEEDWKRAKAELLVLYKELLRTPDLTRNQAKSYHEDIVNQALAARERAKKIQALSASGEGIAQPPDASSGDIRSTLRTATSHLLALD